MNREDFTFFRNIDQNLNSKKVTSSSKDVINNVIDSKVVTGDKFAYLDNAASSQTPDVVVEDMDEYYHSYRANIHRGVYAMSEKASTAYDEVRSAVANMIAANSEDIILTAGSTLSSNMLIYMLEQYIKWDEGDSKEKKESNDSIITTYYEHNSIALPIIELAKRKKLNIIYIDHSREQKEYKVVYNESLGKAERVEVSNSTDGKNRIENNLNSKNSLANKDETVNMLYKIWSEALNEKVKIINMTMASNVTGEIFDMELHINIINKICKEKNIKRPFIISDATAILGHHRINIKNIDVDAMWAGAHKMCGPTGVGMLYIKRELSRKLKPHIYGGGMVSKVTEHDAQYRSDVMAFEAGTANISGVIGWGAAIKYIESIGLKNIEAHIKDLHVYMIEKLSTLPYIKLYTSDSEYNVGIVSFSVSPLSFGKWPGDGTNKMGPVLHPHDIAHILSDNGVAVRAGHHCAPIYMNFINQIALTRASIYFYNTKDDIDLLIQGIEKAWKKLR